MICDIMAPLFGVSHGTTWPLYRGAAHPYFFHRYAVAAVRPAGQSVSPINSMCNGKYMITKIVKGAGLWYPACISSIEVDFRLRSAYVQMKSKIGWLAALTGLAYVIVQIVPHRIFNHAVNIASAVWGS
jgi:hypothetical protein